MGTGYKCNVVGQFFEKVGHQIVGGDLSRNVDGDICLWGTGTTIEVKSSSDQSSREFRLSVEQIENYERTSVFPFDRAWYVLFAYRNHSPRRGKEKRKSQLSEHDDLLVINDYLANAVLWCLVVDISIVSRWKETRSHSTTSIMGHIGTRTVDLKCKYVNVFANGGLAKGLKELNLDPREFATLVGKIKTRVRPDLFSEYTLQFPMTVVLPAVEIPSAQRTLRRRGFRLKRSEIV